MLVLGLDTALQRCSVAIARDGAVLAQGGIDMERGHAEHLAPMVKAVLEDAQVSVADLDRIGVVVGPGGFTGVRVALSFARGLVIGTDIPAVGVTSLAALAGNVCAPPSGLIAPVIDARRGQVYAALYGEGGEPLVPPFVATPKEALQNLVNKAGGHSVTVLGSGAGLLGDRPLSWSAPDAPDQIDAVIVARLAAQGRLSPGAPRPLYLRAPDAKPPRREGLKVVSGD